MPEMHATDEELILHYYGEPFDPSTSSGSPRAKSRGDSRPLAQGDPQGDTRVETHLAECARCRQALEELRHVLALVDAHQLPEPLAGLEQRVWTRVLPEIEARQTGWLSRTFPTFGVFGAFGGIFRVFGGFGGIFRVFGGPPRWAFAGGLAALIVAAFMAGRFSGRDVASPGTPFDVAQGTPQAAGATIAEQTGRVMTVAVGDHLDESQIVLLELLNADTSGMAGIEGEQMRARELVAANRLYRHTAAEAGDEGVREVLDALERVLLEIANAPPDVSARELAALRADIEQRGILFRVRVVASEMRAREQKDVVGSPVGP
jgi:hypothetical protein